MALFRRQIADGISALDEVTDVLNMTDVGNINEITFYVVGRDGTISAGAMQFEEAHAGDYEGDWAPNGSPVTVVEDGEATLKVTGVSAAMRGRMSTAITGDGVVDVWAVGR